MALTYKPNRKLENWRQQFNPLRGLTIKRAVNLLELQERGYYSDVQWLYRFLEKRDATLRALIERRRSALQKLDWDIKIRKEAAEDEGQNKKATAQAKVLREAYNRIDNLTEAIAWLALGEFRGFAHLEKVYEVETETPVASTERDSEQVQSDDSEGAGEDGGGSGEIAPAEEKVVSRAVVHLEPVPQWFMARTMPDTTWLYNERADNSNTGTPIDMGRFVVRETERPINEVALFTHIRKNLAQKDWDAYVETYGLPPLFVEMPPNSSPAHLQDYQAVADQMIGDGRGVLPPGAKIQIPGEGVRGNQPFKEHLEYQDAQLVLAGTGGKLTMLNDPTGLGSGQSESHQDTFEEIAVAEAMTISEIFQDQFDKEVLSEAFPGEDILVYFQLAAKDEVDVDQLVTNVKTLSDAGFKVNAEELQEKIGLEIEEKPPEPVAPGAGPIAKPKAGAKKPVKNRTPADDRLEEETISAASAALLSDLAHVQNRVNSIFSIDNVELRDQKLRQLRQELPTLLKQLNADPALAHVLEDATTAALFNGIEEASA